MKMRCFIAALVTLFSTLSPAGAATLVTAQDLASPAVLGPRSAPTFDLEGENLVDYVVPWNYMFYLGVGSTMVFTNPGTVDMVFTAAHSGGTTGYDVMQDYKNQSGVPFIGLRMELGFGTGDDFVPSTAGDGLNFAPQEAEALFYTSHWSLASLESDVVEWGILSGADGAFPSAFAQSQFAFDIPDMGDEGYTFTLRQTMLVETARPTAAATPEPVTGTLSLLALSALGLSLSGRRRGR